ncbi:MAG TPA: hypothetical protein VNH64_02840 [Parvularculaceae bacterium]|nr:hypothetical protein [Parvularculaceae bacterium]
MKLNIILVAAAFFVCALPAAAQEDQEIVVTGSRIARYEGDIVPVIRLQRKADFMIVSAIVESDSRDAKLRQDEVLKTLEAMATRADRDSKIELGLSRTYESDDDEIEIVAPFTRSALTANLLSKGKREDTSYATVIIKTPIEPSKDTFDGAQSRIAAFVKTVPVTGRATITADQDPGLSIVNLDQYRAPLLKMLAADDVAIQSIFGNSYRLSISGLENPVRWRVTGPLDLAIYFPYKSAVSQN